MNEDNFKIDCKEKAYVLGLLWGDGCLTTVRSKTYSRYISFSMILEDFVEIESFFQSFETNAKWKKYIRNRVSETRNYKHSVTYNLNDRFLAKYLISLGFDKKSNINIEKILSIIPDELKNYWWRGYLDADGCLTVILGKGCHRLAFASTYEQDWSGHIKFLEENFKANPKIYRSINYLNHKHSTLRLGKYKELISFLNYIYKDYENDKMGLYRKYNKYIEIKNNPKNKQVKQINPINNELIKIWYSNKEAGDSLNISYSCISEACNGNRKTAGGFIWSY